MNQTVSPPPATGGRPERSSRDKARLVAVAIIGGVLAAFALVNLNTVKVDWIVGSAHSPLILVIVISFLLGALAGRPLFSRGRRSRSR